MLRFVVVLLLCAACVITAGASPPPLANGGFEELPLLSGWSSHVYGAQPAIAADTEVRHGGTRSLRVSADAPSDTAFGQEIMLRPAGWYLLQGWVRTRGLSAGSARTAGTLEVQMPGGQSVLAAGQPHTGDTDWTRISVPFRAPADGRTRIAIFFVGYGRGTGTAWFDDITLEEMEPAMAPIRVTTEAIRGAKISPMQMGQFVEYLCDLVGGMWAEKLYDTSFEGLTPFRFEFIKETDYREKPWRPCGAVNRAEHTADPERPIGGTVARRIRVAEGAPCTVGVAQDGVAVRRGAACRFTGWFRAEGLAGPVTLSITDGARTVAAAEVRPGGAWARHAVRLAPTATSAAATFSITFRGPGTLWLDSVSLMPEETVGGWRPDVVAALRRLRPGVIRFGGSVVDYASYGDFGWRDTIGDPDRRRPFRSWGGLQPTGAGLEEFVALCRAVDAEPLICVRFRGSTPAEAAAQVEYFNGAADTPMGSERARNGHPAPWGVRYWQVGNEVGGAEYEDGAAAFCRAMRAADPTIKLLSSYPSPALLRSAGDLIDYVCPHHYGCADLPGMEANIAELRQMIAAHAPGRTIRLGVTEWNTTAGDWGPARAMLWNLSNALACSRYHNLLHRNADIVEIACRSNLTNSFCSGILQTDNARLYCTPTYYAQQLYANMAGDTPLRLESRMPLNMGVDISATLSRDRRMLTLFAVNDGPEDESRTMDLRALGIGAGAAETWTLADTDRAGEPDVTNSFARPRRIVPVRSRTPLAPECEITFPRLSLTVIRIRLR